MSNDDLTHVFVSYIKTTPEKLWEAITGAEFTQRYFQNCAIQSDFKPDSTVVYVMQDGATAAEGTILESNPPQRLSYTWMAKWGPDVGDDPASRVTWEIEAVGEQCKLTLVHDEFASETATYKGVGDGWPHILSSLKTLLETGTPLPGLS